MRKKNKIHNTQNYKFHAKQADHYKRKKRGLESIRVKRDEKKGVHWKDILLPANYINERLTQLSTQSGFNVGQNSKLEEGEND